MDGQLKAWEDLVQRVESGMTTERDGQVVRELIEEVLDLRNIVSKMNEPLEEAYDIPH